MLFISIIVITTTVLKFITCAMVNNPLIEVGMALLFIIVLRIFKRLLMSIISIDITFQLFFQDAG